MGLGYDDWWMEWWIKVDGEWWFLISRLILQGDNRECDKGWEGDDNDIVMIWYDGWNSY